ncbi:MAG TPA: Maf family nucleotide pyrophosphatase [Casimicrobiaceae bacterium]|nr:Maf family nucleotide pyrophosphatase [Casimicrobiaceae bacterium]
MPNRPLILASSSRYRRELLERLGYPFEVRAPRVDESPKPAERPRDTALRLAEAKARAIAASLRHGLVIGSDQVADDAGVAVSKPGDHAHAVALLASLSGRTLVFHTAVALIDCESARIQRECVDVVSTFRKLSMTDVEKYVGRDRPYDCAGAVRSEGLGIALFERIASDDPTTLIGLPLIALNRMLRNEGVDVLATS